MGYFKVLAKSNIKSKLMKELIKIIEKKRGDEIEAYQKLYNCLKDFEGLSCLVQYYDFTCEEFIEISHQLRSLGHGWEKGDYIPVSVFCFCKPLMFILENRDVFKKGSYEEILKVILYSSELLRKY